MQVEEILFRGKNQRKTLRISLLDDYYYQTPSIVANQNAGFALVHYLGDTKSQYPMRPKAMRARGIIVLVKSNQLVTKISRLNIFHKLKLGMNSFFPPKHYKYGGRFSLLVGYNIQPTTSTTNQNAALMIDHQLDFTNSYWNGG